MSLCSNPDVHTLFIITYIIYHHIHLSVCGKDYVETKQIHALQILVVIIVQNLKQPSNLLYNKNVEKTI